MKFAGPAEPADAAIDYETAKRLVTSRSVADRLRVAATTEAMPELLYYLANDAAPEVRRSVARNVQTPRRADFLLSRDQDEAVRGDIAGKLAVLIPDMPAAQMGQIERMTIGIVESLARDAAVEVRRVLSESLKALPNVPHGVIQALARDVEISVAGPVLRNSPILTEDDLIEIILGMPIEGAVSAIAGRENLPSVVADAVVAYDDPQAIAVLLANASAQIRENTLDRLIDRAPRHELWHEPLVRRPKLPARAAIRLAEFVAETLLEELKARSDLPPEAIAGVVEVVRRRLGSPGAAVPAAGATAAARAPDGAAGLKPGELPDPYADQPDRRPRESSAQMLARLKKEGKLTERVLADALGAGDRQQVIAGLALLAEITNETAERIINSRSPRPVVALIWKAGLSARFAYQVQLRLAGIPPARVLKPVDGSEFPMKKQDMVWQLDYFSGAAG